MRKSDRPELNAAITARRQHSATLVIAKLDRLAGNVTGPGLARHPDRPRAKLASSLEAAGRGVVHHGQAKPPQAPSLCRIATEIASKSLK